MYLRPGRRTGQKRSPALAAVIVSELPMNRGIDWIALRLRRMHSRFSPALLRDTIDQFVQSRKQKLHDGRLVRVSVAEDQIDSGRVSLERATRYRRSEKILCVSR